VNPLGWAVRTDGHFTGDHDVAVLINESKNRSAGNFGLPEVELVRYFAHSFASSTCLESLDENLQGWMVLAVGITIVGMSRMLQHRLYLVLIILVAQARM
jgi:hypothetical protein